MNIYLIFDPFTDLHKIGITKNDPKRRLRALRRKYFYGDQLDFVATASGEKSTIEELETELHDLFAEQRTERKTWMMTEDANGNVRKVAVKLNGHSEWFKLSSDDVDCVLNAFNQ